MALEPNTAARLTAYTLATAIAAGPFASRISTTPAGSDTKNATWWIRPRKRGLGGAMTATKTPSSYPGRLGLPFVDAKAFRPPDRGRPRRRARGPGAFRRSRAVRVHGRVPRGRRRDRRPTRCRSRSGLRGDRTPRRLGPDPAARLHRRAHAPGDDQAPARPVRAGGAPVGDHHRRPRPPRNRQRVRDRWRPGAFARCRRGPARRLRDGLLVRAGLAVRVLGGHDHPRGHRPPPRHRAGG